ncbi:Hemoglobin subunit beta [Oryzias melastigma]|uniref:Hemoglobin subunit beta n=1 Tax=Oryzias melastigma TaxID=30732 RepID=A0A834FCU5_ORYME|nr:Hemoglobin subunit beta [Oryzias melastigma]
MVEWTEQERSIITNIFANLDYEDVGSKALSRCLIVYPWTQRYFASFGNLYNADAIKTNPNIAAHGTKVLHGLDRAVKNMDNIKATYAELSVLHSEKLHVDPDNFKVSVTSAGAQRARGACVRQDVRNGVSPSPAAAGRLLDHRHRRQNGLRLQPGCPGDLPEVPGRGGVRPGKAVPLEPAEERRGDWSSDICSCVFPPICEEIKARQSKATLLLLLSFFRV